MKNKKEEDILNKNIIIQNWIHRKRCVTVSREKKRVKEIKIVDISLVKEEGRRKEIYYVYKTSEHKIKSCRTERLALKLLCSISSSCAF